MLSLYSESTWRYHIGAYTTYHVLTEEALPNVASANSVDLEKQTSAARFATLKVKE